jgi:predicted SAM-dependent methyltransferase
MENFKNKFTTTGPGLMIGIPTLGRPVSLEWAMAFKSLAPPINYNTTISIVYGKPVDEARNQLAEEALKLNARYLFFLGDDVVPPLHTLRQLIFRVEQNESIGVCGGVYCSKSNPPAPLVFRGNGIGSYWDWKAGEFFEVSGLGMDCTLIRTEVFSKISKPWFKTIDSDQFQKGRNEANMWTEDLYFCSKVLKETNFKVFCDASILCKHIDIYSGKEYFLPSESLPMRRFVVDGKLALDIGCGPIDRSDQFPGFKLVRVDIRDECNPDYRCDVRMLPFDDKTFDLVFSSHVLEHFSRDEWENVLDEWLRVLKNDGEILLILPNLEWAFEQYKELGELNEDALNVLYGAQSNEFDYHYNGFYPKRIKNKLEEKGFTVSLSFQGYNMFVQGVRHGTVVV